VNQLVIVAYNLADAYWLSSYSEVTVAVPRQIWPVIMLFQALAMALTTASLSIVTQYVGGKAYKKASLEASRFFTASFFSGAILSFSLFMLRSTIFMSVVSTPPEIFEDVMKYSGVIAFDVFLNYIALTYTTLLQSVGDTKRPAIINLISVGINVLLDPFFILGIGPFPRLGVVGAALTDVIGKIISISALTFLVKRKYPELKISFTKKIDAEWASLVLRIGLPILTLGLMNGFAFLMQLRLVNMLGIIVATAYSIGFIIMDIVDTALWGLSGAPAIMIGQSLGAGHRERAREVAFKAALLILALMVLGAGAIYPISRVVGDVFVDDPYLLNETELLAS
jgi:putative MATE family efflux protein